MKAVRNAPPSVEVVDVEEPQGEGELVRVAATGICASDLKYLGWGSTQIASSVFNTQPEVSDLPLAMRQILLRAAVLLMSWAIGLLIAAWIVPGVSLSVPGFIVAVVVFSVAQAILSLPMLKLPRQYASLLLGGTGLVLTIVALILASVLTHGITIDGMAPWVATTVVVWLVTTIGAITLPELRIRDESGST